MRISDWSSDVCSSDLDGELFAAAKSCGVLNSRSAAQQIDHWARIGRELESSANLSHRDIQAVLAGDGSYDRLQEREQAIVRATWDEQIAQRIGSVNLAEKFRASGAGYAEADEHGNLIRSDEHTSELQSLMRNSYAVFCLKKKTQPHTISSTTDT